MLVVSDGKWKSQDVYGPTTAQILVKSLEEGVWESHCQAGYLWNEFIWEGISSAAGGFLFWSVPLPKKAQDGLVVMNWQTCH